MDKLICSLEKTLLKYRHTKWCRIIHQFAVFQLNGLDFIKKFNQKTNWHSIDYTETSLENTMVKTIEKQRNIKSFRFSVVRGNGNLIHFCRPSFCASLDLSEIIVGRDNKLYGYISFVLELLLKCESMRTSKNGE